VSLADRIGRCLWDCASWTERGRARLGERVGLCQRQPQRRGVVGRLLGRPDPEDIRHDSGWSCVKFQGPFDLGETGIMLSVIKPLSEEGIGVFVVSTFDTDYPLVKAASRVRVGDLLARAGHTVR
jgi:hypothetical protein